MMLFTMLLYIYGSLQADLLARFKPTLNASALVSDLSSAEHTMAEALEFFKRFLYEKATTGNNAICD